MVEGKRDDETWQAWAPRVLAAGVVPVVVPLIVDGEPAVCSGGFSGGPHDRFARDKDPDARAYVALDFCRNLYVEGERLARRGGHTVERPA